MWEASIAGAGVAAWSFYVPDGPAALDQFGGVDLSPLARSTYVVWQGRLDSAAVDVLRVTFRDPPIGQVELYWNGPGDDLAPQRFQLQSPLAHDTRRVDFPVHEARTWSGVVTRLGLRLVPVMASPPSLLHVEGLRFGYA